MNAYEPIHKPHTRRGSPNAGFYPTSPTSISYGFGGDRSHNNIYKPTPIDPIGPTNPINPLDPMESQRKSSNPVGRTTTSNKYLIPYAVFETFILLGLIAMNYVFRFNAITRDGASLSDYSRMTLIPRFFNEYPYYDYSLSHADNQDNLLGFGITFGMPEYAFFVPVFLVPLLLMVLTEVLFYRLSPTLRLSKTVESYGLLVPHLARRIFRLYYIFLLCGSLAGIFASFIKFLVPIARPHFIAVCMTSSKSKDLFENCMNPNHSEIKEALRSFPSYHATIAVFCAVFLCLYFHHRTHFKGLYCVGASLSVPVVAMFTIGALHRWATYHAHFRDIVWGAVLGGAMAIYAVHGLLNKFQESAWTNGPSNGPVIPHSIGPMDVAPEPSQLFVSTTLPRAQTPMSRAQTPMSRGVSQRSRRPPHAPPMQAFNNASFDPGHGGAGGGDEEARFRRAKTPTPSHGGYSQRFSEPTPSVGVNRSIRSPPPQHQRMRGVMEYETRSYF